jgi:hypothetical protein
MNDAPVLIGSIVVTIRAGKCGSCSATRMVFVNFQGRTRCAGCVAHLSTNQQLEQT